MEPENPEESRPALAEVPRRGHGEPVRYDFRRAEHIAPEQVRPMEAAFAAFLAGLQASLSAYLRAPCTAAPSETRQLSYGEAAAQVPSPGVLVTLTLRPYDGCGFLQLSGATVFAMLGALLGARGAPAPDLERELTEIERYLLAGILRIATHEIREAWRPLGAPAFELQTSSTGAREADAASTNDAMLVLSGELALGDQSGPLRLLLPSLAVKMMSRRAEPQRPATPAGSGPARERLAQLLGAARVSVEARLDGSRVTLQDVAALQCGSMLDLGHPVGQPLACFINGKPKYLAQPVSLEGKLGIQVDGGWQPQ